jgi:hypothetical protein
VTVDAASAAAKNARVTFEAALGTGRHVRGLRAWLAVRGHRLREGRTVLHYGVHCSGVRVYFCRARVGDGKGHMSFFDYAACGFVIVTVLYMFLGD